MEGNIFSSQNSFFTEHFFSLGDRKHTESIICTARLFRLQKYFIFSFQFRLIIFNHFRSQIPARHTHTHTHTQDTRLSTTCFVLMSTALLVICLRTLCLVGLLLTVVLRQFWMRYNAYGSSLCIYGAALLCVPRGMEIGCIKTKQGAHSSFALHGENVCCRTSGSENKSKKMWNTKCENWAGALRQSLEQGQRASGATI